MAGRDNQTSSEFEMARRGEPSKGRRIFVAEQKDRPLAVSSGERFRTDEYEALDESASERPWPNGLDMSQCSQGISGTFSRYPPSGYVPFSHTFSGHAAKSDKLSRSGGVKDYHRPDRRIYEEICERLTRHPAIDVSGVSVTVKEGAVILNGKVSSTRMKRIITGEVQKISGVNDVNNQLQLAGSSQH